MAEISTSERRASHSFLRTTHLPASLSTTSSDASACTSEKVAEQYDMVIQTRFDIRWGKPIDELSWAHGPTSRPGLGFRFLSEYLMLE